MAMVMQMAGQELKYNKIQQLTAGIALQLAQIQMRNSIVYLTIMEKENKQIILNLRQMILK